MWHTTKLSDDARRLLTYGNNLDEWERKLTERFKEQASIATASLLREKYTMYDAQQQREPREYAQKIIRHAKSAELTSIFNQLNVIYNGIDVEFRQVLKKPTNTTNLDTYLQEMDDMKEIWWTIARKRANTQQGFRNIQSNYSKPYGRGFRSGVSNYYPSGKQNRNWPNNFANSRGYGRGQPFLVPVSGQTPKPQSEISQLPAPPVPKMITDKPTEPNNGANRWGTQDARNWGNNIYRGNGNYRGNPNYRGNQNYRGSYRNWNSNGGRWDQQRAYQTRAYHGEEGEDEYVLDDPEAYYGDGDYLEDRGYEDAAGPSYEEPGDAQNYEPDDPEPDANVHFMEPKALTFTCRNCKAEFTSNNKLHKHVRSCRLEGKVNLVQVLPSHKLPIIDSTKQDQNHYGFAFRSYRYATVKASLAADSPTDEFCVDSGTSMSLIDKGYLKAKCPQVEIKRMVSPSSVRGIGTQLHDTSSYAVLDFYVPGTAENNQVLAHFKGEVHLVDDLRANVLIGMDIVGPEKMKLNFENNTLTIPTCKGFQAPIQVERRSEMVNRAVRAVAKTTIPPGMTMPVPVRMRGKRIPNDKDYSFHPMKEHRLGPEGGFFAHVADANLVAVQVRNTSSKPFVVPKNFKIGHLRDYVEEGCYLADPEDRHLAVVSSKIDLRKKISLDTVLPNGVTVYGDSSAVNRITTIVDEYSDIFRTVPGMVDVPQDQWMKINTISDAEPGPMRVFRLGDEDRKKIDKEFDALHENGKMEWSTKPTPYAYPVFVVWHMMHLPGKPPTRRARMIIDIRGLNKISKFDAYPMPLQADIISSLQGCQFISLMDCAIFFHQWRVAPEDRHKLTVVTHRGAEQWNVAVMGYKNTGAYVQRQMGNLMRACREFSRAYIDDIVVFSTSLEEHLRHIEQVFRLFRQYNITLKAKKTYLGYPSISLLGQKVDSLGLTTAEDKLKAIVALFFPNL